MVTRQAFALCVLAVALASCRGEAPQASVQILAPIDGAVVPGPNVRVLLGVSGVEIAPATDQRLGTGHHHLFVDREVTPLSDTIPAGVTGIIHLGRAQTEFTLEGLAPGEHTVIAVLANWAHVPLTPPAMDTIRFTVQ